MPDGITFVSVKSAIARTGRIGVRSGTGTTVKSQLPAMRDLTSTLVARLKPNTQITFC